MVRLLVLGAGAVLVIAAVIGMISSSHGINIVLLVSGLITLIIGRLIK